MIRRWNERWKQPLEDEYVKHEQLADIEEPTEFEELTELEELEEFEEFDKLYKLADNNVLEFGPGKGTMWETFENYTFGI